MNVDEAKRVCKDLSRCQGGRNITLGYRGPGTQRATEECCLVSMCFPCAPPRSGEDVFLTFLSAGIHPLSSFSGQSCLIVSKSLHQRFLVLPRQRSSSSSTHCVTTLIHRSSCNLHTWEITFKPRQKKYWIATSSVFYSFCLPSWRDFMSGRQSDTSRDLFTNTGLRDK